METLSKSAGNKENDAAGYGQYAESMLLAAIGSGDREAFAFLYRMWYPKVRSFTRKFCGEDAISMDITQDIFMMLWENRDRLTDIGNLSAYLFTAARNSCSKYIRDYLTHVRPTDPSGLPETAAPDMAGEILCRDILDHISETIQNFPPQERRVFLLSRNEGLSYKEIASRLGISVNTVRNHVENALQRLKAVEYLVLLELILDMEKI